MPPRTDPLDYPAPGQELTPALAAARYPRLWSTIGRDFGDLSPTRQAQLAELISGVCGTCRDAEPTCRCWDRG